MRPKKKFKNWKNFEVKSDLITSITETDDELPLNKTIETPSMIIVVRAVFIKITNTVHKFFK